MNFLNMQENNNFKIENGWLVNVFTHERVCKILPPNQRPISTLIKQEIKMYKTGVSVSFSDRGLFIKKFMLNNGKYLYKFTIPHSYHHNHIHIYSITDLPCESGVLLRFDYLFGEYFVFKTYNLRVFESKSFKEIDEIVTQFETPRLNPIKTQLSDVSTLTHQMIDE